MEAIQPAQPAIRPRPEYAMWALGAVLMVAFSALALRGQINLLATVLITGTLLLVSIRDKAAAALLTLAYLTLMGDIRRIVSYVGDTPSLDLLLLVGPVLATVLAVPLLLRVRLKDGLSKAMLVLLILMLVQVFNPKQGGLAIGFSGALFYIAPMFWFWIGRRYASPAVLERLFYWLLFPLALLASLLGLAQTFIGFLPWEQAWIDVAAKVYTALHVGNSIRAFGYSVSATEYATLMTIAAAGIVATAFAGRRLWLLAIPFLITGIIIASARGLVLKLVVTLACVWALRKGEGFSVLRFVRLAILAVVGLLGMGFVASRFAPPEDQSSQNQSAVQQAVAHQAGGLSHPFDEHYSTAGIHTTMIVDAIVRGFTYPIGYGLGSTTSAGTKFGGDPTSGSSEVDFSDMFISLGLLGGCLYLYVIYATGRRALRYSQVVRRSISLPVLAILICTLASWLIGGQYSTSALIFFIIGGLVYDQESPVIGVTSEKLWG
jgi:hypothetical protein